VARVVFTAAADADAAYIFEDLYAKAGKPTVIKYRALFKKLYDNLTDFPDSGPPRPKIGANIRIGVVSPYIVIYKHNQADDAINVLRIVHGRRKITGKLLRGVS
jgi:toxin ParE1/3/4